MCYLLSMSFSQFCVVLLAIISHVAGEIKNRGWWKNIVFYEIYPRSFMDSDGDGVGDIKGITSKMEHFVESGIGGVWLTPIYVSPMVDFGYDISDFRAIDPTFGTMEDFEEMLAKAKQLGIKVIVDFVPNHSSDQHEWFQKSLKGEDKYKDYYVWHRGRENNTKPPNDWGSVFSGSAWTYRPERDLWYLHQFDRRQPDLNFNNLDVHQEMEDIIKFWLSKGVDGIRIDAVNFVYEKDEYPDELSSNKPGASPGDNTNLTLNTNNNLNDPRDYELIVKWRKVLDEWSDSHDEDEKIIMTEAYGTVEGMTEYYNSGSNIPFNFMFITQISINSKPNDYKKAIDDWMVRIPKNAVANWVLGNHDRSRLATRYPDRMDQLMMLMMILPGIAVPYYGEEIGMLSNDDISWEDTVDPQACNAEPNRLHQLSRDPARTPFQWDDSKNAGFSNGSKTWLPIHPNYKTLNLALQKTQPESHYKLFTTLTSLRNSSETLKNAPLETVVLNNNEVLAIVRRTPVESIILLINFSNDAQQDVSLNEYVPEVAETTVVASSVGSGVEWGSRVDSSKIQIPSKVTVVVVAKSNE